MPLPFAPPPSQSKVYRDLKNIKLNDLTTDEFDALKAALFTQGVDSSEDEMRRLNLVGEASNQTSSSGCIPGTSRIEYVSGITNSHTVIFKPESGSVFQLFAASVPTLDGASTMILKLDDGSNQIVVDTHNSTSEPFELNEPIFVSNEVWLIARTSDASGGNAIVGAAFVRVR